MEPLQTHFRASAITLYMNHQPSKEHPGHELRVIRDAARALQGRTSPGPMAEVAKAAQNTSSGPREKAQLRAVCMFLCEPFHARGGNTCPTVHVALCCTALTATELGGGEFPSHTQGTDQKAHL